MTSFDKWRSDNKEKIDHIYSFIINKGKEMGMNVPGREYFEEWLFASYDGFHIGYPTRKYAPAKVSPIYPVTCPPV